MRGLRNMRRNSVASLPAKRDYSASTWSKKEAKPTLSPSSSVGRLVVSDHSRHRHSSADARARAAEASKATLASTSRLGESDDDDDDDDGTRSFFLAVPSPMSPMSLSTGALPSPRSLRSAPTSPLAYSSAVSTASGASGASLGVRSVRSTSSRSRKGARRARRASHVFLSPEEEEHVDAMREAARMAEAEAARNARDLSYVEGVPESWIDDDGSVVSGLSALEDRSWGAPPALPSKGQVEDELMAHSEKLATMRISAYKRSMATSASSVGGKAGRAGIVPVDGLEGRNKGKRVSPVKITRFVSEYTSPADAGLDDGIYTLEKHIRRTGGKSVRAVDAWMAFPVTTPPKDVSDETTHTCSSFPSSDSDETNTSTTTTTTTTTTTATTSATATTTGKASYLSSRSMDSPRGDDDLIRSLQLENKGLRAQLDAVMASRRQLRDERDALELQVAALKARLR